MKTIHLIIFSAVALFMGSCANMEEVTHPVGEPDVIAVKMAPLTQFKIPDVIQTTGLVSTENETNYAFKIGGVIQKISVEEGQFFRKGQVLAMLNTTEIGAGVAQSEIGLAKAQRDYDRAVNLYRDSVFSLEQLQNTKTLLDLAKQTRQEVVFNEHYATIYATSDGFVTKKMAHEGEIVAGGMPVLLTRDTAGESNYILKVGVTDIEWSTITIGQKATVNLDGYPNHPVRAIVSKKLQAADREIGSFQVELTLDLDKLIPPVGMFGTADITTQTNQKALVIPYSSLVEADGNRGFIYTLVDSNKVKKIPVNILKFENKKVYLSDSLTGINEIVISNSAFLNEQSVIKVIK